MFRRIPAETALLLLLATIGLAGLVYATVSRRDNAFTIEFHHRYTPAGATTSRVTTTGVRYQWTDGAFKVVRQSPAGRHILVGEPGDGVYALKPAEGFKVFVSNKGVADSPTLEQLRAAPDFAGESRVLGYQVVVSRLDGESGYTELYRAPALQGVILKTVHVSYTNGTTVVEPLKIINGAPRAERQFNLDALKTDRAPYQQKMEDAGLNPAASSAVN